ncbi:hypothetical protein EVAR_36146_1 [Eumeta japonica]|uniref:Uncharacterized protein n=1 Tax=Eumeta variegata TaxID=151549 RepID=A0A4C1X5B4_EUMVA|nr:hypothetical protein EVAR_36146_1 [Eumeta japonica]
MSMIGLDFASNTALALTLKTLCRHEQIKEKLIKTFLKSISAEVLKALIYLAVIRRSRIPNDVPVNALGSPRASLSDEAAVRGSCPAGAGADTISPTLSPLSLRRYASRALSLSEPNLRV